MLVTGLEMQVAAENFPSFRKRPRFTHNANAPPARLRLRVRIPGLASSPALANSPRAYVNAVLITAGLFSDAGADVLPRFTATIHPHDSFVAFDYDYLADRDYFIRIDFMLMRPDASAAPSRPGTPGRHPAIVEKHFGTVETSLSEIMRQNHLDVQVRPARAVTGTRRDDSGDGSGDANEFDAHALVAKTAELDVKWRHVPNEALIFDVRVRIDTTTGWPFHSARPFFVLYRWEQPLKTWTPIYRSEVLTRPTHTEEAPGYMVFRLANLKMSQAIGTVDERSLRIEFFHYKLSDAPRMIGSVSTSLAELRQVSPASRLKLILNIFPKGDLVGDMVLHDSCITEKYSYFCLQGDFGGPVVGKLVFFALNVSDPHGTLGRTTRRGPHLFYTISHYNSKGLWEELHRSETQSRTRGTNTHTFSFSKITETKLSNEHSNTSKIVCFTLYTRTGAKKRGEGIEVGQFSTRVDDMLKWNRKDTFRLQKEDTTIGNVRINQAEKSSQSIYFDIACVLGDDFEKSAE